MTKLVIGNKSYSSWSIRAWFFLRHSGIPFEEIVVPLDRPETHASIARWSPSGRVPALILDDGDVVWDSLAIGECIHETWPKAGVWPENAKLRRLARSAAAEMHSSFGELRRVLTCNVRTRFEPESWRKLAGGKDAEAQVEADIARVGELWRTLLEASGGPFLAGGFSYVDSFFVPVVSRFVTYGITLPKELSQYAERVRALPTYVTWLREANAEPWTIAKYEYDLPRIATV